MEDLRAWLFRKEWDFSFNSILARCFKYFHISPFFLQNGLAVQFSAICRGTYQLHTYILKDRPIPFRSCMEMHSSTFTRLQNKGRNYMLKGRNYNFYEHEGFFFTHNFEKFALISRNISQTVSFAWQSENMSLKLAFFSILLG